MIFALDDYVELHDYPNVIWRVDNPPRFNGGHGLYSLAYVGADSPNNGERCRRKLGLSALTFRTHAQGFELTSANPLLVLALLSH